jgi:hypothetical protein
VIRYFRFHGVLNCLPAAFLVFVFLGQAIMKSAAQEDSEMTQGDGHFKVIEKRVTNASHGHILANFGVWSADGQWIVYDVRSDPAGEDFDGKQIERIHVITGKVETLFASTDGASCGVVTTSPADDRVSAFDLNGWRHADDPQPSATGSGGSPWPALGDELVAELDVPVGFISVGWGGTRVQEWMPGEPGPDTQPLYNRLRDALQALGPDGARAVLWHQGESDNVANTSTADYRQRLETVIAQSRIDAGFDIPWGVAQASFLPGILTD